MPKPRVRCVQFKCGYMDRFRGTVENFVTAFNWHDDLDSISHKVLAIPQHRIRVCVCVCVCVFVFVFVFVLGFSHRKYAISRRLSISSGATLLCGAKWITSIWFLGLTRMART